jgi:CDP-diacylglycerol pyrophosphatase
MSAGLFRHTKPGSFGGRPTVFRALTVVATIGACTAFLFLAADASQRDLPRNALWEVVHNVCVPGQSLHHDPSPCLQVDLTGGIENGFAILRDPRGGTQFLLIPTTQVSGIESPTVRGPNATNYFASAWEARTHIDDALHLTLPRDDIGLAINSVVSRSQDQLHIHFSCIRADVWETLRKHQENIGNQWAPFKVSLVGHRYIAMWVSGEHLSPHNPFRLLAEGLPYAMRDMGNHTLVVIGLTRTDGTKGFVILVDYVNKERGDLANGEELLDNACHVAVVGKKAHVHELPLHAQEWRWKGRKRREFQINEVSKIYSSPSWLGGNNSQVIDISIDDHGSIFIARPVTETGKAWFSHYVDLNETFQRLQN